MTDTKSKPRDEQRPAAPPALVAALHRDINRIAATSPHVVPHLRALVDAIAKQAREQGER